MLKNFFLSEKKLLNTISRAKLKSMKFFLSNGNEQFFAIQKTDFREFELFCRKVILELNAQNQLF